MKKLTRRSFTAAGILAALGIGTGLKGCNPFKPSDNEVVDVYGPPDVDPSEWDYDPDGNVVETVYGPPEDFGEPAEYEPDENVLEDVYGPPEDFDPVENTPAPVYGPPAG